MLTYGISDPDHSEYCSLADFYCNESVIEIRIPWYLLNVMNSTVGECLSNFYGNEGIVVQQIPDIRLGVGISGQTEISLQSMGYTVREKSLFHTRLKKSYAIIQQGMNGFMEY